MADLSPAFADNGERRAPTTDEQSDGFACGPADRALFNYLLHRLESEIGHVIDYAGIVGSNGDMTQLRQAIEALIGAAVGDTGLADFILMSQARLRLPIFPEVQNVDGRFVVTTPAPGTVRLPGGVTFLHRGIYPITPIQTDFLTDPSKIYHLRWNPTDGFALKDLASGTYNPTALVETNIAFDTTYDDMLVARVITSAGNVATITNLANKSRLVAEGNSAPLDPTEYADDVVDLTSIVPATLGNSLARSALNWSRRPRATLAAFTDVTVQHPSSPGAEMNIVVRALDRYNVESLYQRTNLAAGGVIFWSADA